MANPQALPLWHESRHRALLQPRERASTSRTTLSNPVTSQGQGPLAAPTILNYTHTQNLPDEHLFHPNKPSLVSNVCAHFLKTPTHTHSGGCTNTGSVSAATELSSPVECAPVAKFSLARAVAVPGQEAAVAARSQGLFLSPLYSTMCLHSSRSAHGKAIAGEKPPSCRRGLGQALQSRVFPFRSANRKQPFITKEGKGEEEVKEVEVGDWRWRRGSSKKPKKKKKGI